MTALCITQPGVVHEDGRILHNRGAPSLQTRWYSFLVYLFPPHMWSLSWWQKRAQNGPRHQVYDTCLYVLCMLEGSRLCMHVQQQRWVRPHLVLGVARDLHAAHGVHELEVGHKLLAVRGGLRRQGHRHCNRQG